MPFNSGRYSPALFQTLLRKRGERNFRLGKFTNDGELFSGVRDFRQIISIRTWKKSWKDLLNEIFSLLQILAFIQMVTA